MSSRHTWLTVLLVVSVALNIAMVVKVRLIRSELASAAFGLAKGELVPSIRAHTVSGELTDVASSDGKRVTILYFFSPHCKWCARNSSSVRALATALGPNYRILGISVTDENLPADMSQYPFPLYTYPDPSAIKSLRLFGTPQTLVVDQRGRVLHNWMGSYDPPLRQTIEAALGVTLDGVAAR